MPADAFRGDLDHRRAEVDGGQREPERQQRPRELAGPAPHLEDLISGADRGSRRDEAGQLGRIAGPCRLVQPGNVVEQPPLVPSRGPFGLILSFLGRHPSIMPWRAEFPGRYAPFCDGGKRRTRCRRTEAADVQEQRGKGSRAKGTRGRRQRREEAERAAAGSGSAEEQRKRAAFLATPVGAATMAKKAGHRFLEDPSFRSAAHEGTAGLGSTTSRRSAASSADNA